MSERVRLALAGIGGYGDFCLEALLHDPRSESATLAGVVDPAPQSSRWLGELQSRGVPVHATLEALFDASPLDLLITSTPIHLHRPQTCFALARGANVLCEKPLAGSLADARIMVECERRSNNRFVAIGFQWCFSDAIRSLKRDILAGTLGRALRMRTIVCPPRPRAYFTRSSWVGRVRTAAGEAVLDSPVNNANAHYLHNMLYLLGETRETSAMPQSVQAELYRANEIENYDTAALHVCAAGCELLFLTSHAVPERIGPKCVLEFERGVVEYDATTTRKFVARFADGRVRDYGNPNADPFRKIWDCVRSMENGTPPACGAVAALAHTICVVAAQQSGEPIVDFPHSLRRTIMIDDKPLIFVDGLAAALVECYERGVLPAALGTLSWAKPAEPVVPDHPGTP